MVFMIHFACVGKYSDELFSISNLIIEEFNWLLLAYFIDFESI